MSIENALESLTLLLRKREKELDERETELSNALKKFEAERLGTYGDTTSSDVMHLNVGGKTMAVLRRTLTLIEGSMLASRFSGRWDDSIEKDNNGYFFVDQEFELFEAMVNYLRHRSNEIGECPAESPTFATAKKNRDFCRMVEYYGMTLGVFPSELIVTYKSSDIDVLEHEEKKEITLLGLLEVNAKEWCTLEIRRRGHNKTINTFEVTLGSVQRVQIGWAYEEIKSYGNSIGVGDVENTLSIDLSRSCFLSEGVRTDIGGLELKEGTVVRSEDFGNKWFVDGRLVASSHEGDGVVKISGSSFTSDKVALRPVISVKGDVHVSAIEYMN